MIGIRLVTFSGGSKIEKRGRAQGDSVVGKAEGDNSREFEPEVYAAHGIVSRPSKKTRGVVLQIGNLSFTIAAYTYGVAPPENDGAVKLYGTDAGGAEQSSVLLDSDGTVTVNDGSDFAVRFSALEDAFNELKGKFNSHTHTGVTTGTGSTGTTATPSTADISSAKIEEIKVP